MINISYACFEAKKRGEVFDEKVYNDIENKNRVHISSMIDMYHKDHWNPLVSTNYISVSRVNNAQYEGYVIGGHEDTVL